MTKNAYLFIFFALSCSVIQGHELVITAKTLSGAPESNNTYRFNYRDTITVTGKQFGSLETNELNITVSKETKKPQTITCAPVLFHHDKYIITGGSLELNPETKIACIFAEPNNRVFIETTDRSKREYSSCDYLEINTITGWVSLKNEQKEHSKPVTTYYHKHNETK